MRVVQGRPQHYDWGDERAIPELLGLPPDGRPWAEFWWGTHPAAPSSLDDGEPLVEVTGSLPYLVKLLAAARPLSLQLHPSAEQAAAGYARDTERRIYRDPWPKPEMICALTTFEAVCGLAPRDLVGARLERLGAAAAELRRRFRDHGARAVVTWLLRERPDISGLVAAASEVDEAWARWMVRIADHYPGDRAVAAIPLLNFVVLQPGEALFLGAGHLHAYLQGVGLEVMGPSDNVVRGGLTSKHVDVDAVVELMRDDVLTDPLVRPRELTHGGARINRYEAGEAPFVVERWTVDSDTDITAEGDELWWCSEGTGDVRRGSCVLLRNGERRQWSAGYTLFRVTAAGPHPVPGRGDVPGR